MSERVAGTYRYSNLTTALADRSPLRAYLEATFPHIRDIQRAYRASAGEILIDSSDVNPGTLGTAFDTMIRLRFRPAEIPSPAVPIVIAMPPACRSAYDDLLGIAALNNRDFLAAAAWAFALATEVYRTGRVWPGTPMAALFERDTFDVDDLLDLAPETAIVDLHYLDLIARDYGFYKTLGKQRQRKAIRAAYAEEEDIWAAAAMVDSDDGLTFGATFATGPLIAADADVIAAGTLVEIKTRLGGKHENGERFDSLPARDVYQLVAYVLLDTLGSHHIDAIAIYSARYGHYMRWPLAGLLDELAGRPVDLADERKKVFDLLDTGEAR